MKKRILTFREVELYFLQERLPPESPMRTQGFTVTELVMVIAIIAVLFAMLVASAVVARDSANTTRCLSNLNGIGQGLAAYAAFSKGVVFPPTGGYRAPPSARWYRIVFPRDGADDRLPGVLRCPSHAPEPFDGNSYLLNSHITLLDIRLHSRSREGIGHAEVVVVGEKRAGNFPDFYLDLNQYDTLAEERRHQRRKRSNYLFLDGHAASVEPWQAKRGCVDPWDPGLSFFDAL